MANLDNLRVYHRARPVCARIWRLAGGIRDAELRDQIRRAAISVVSNIAEGGAGRSDADFARFLVTARGSVEELKAQLGFCADIGVIDATSASGLTADLVHIARMLAKLIGYLRSS